jgi:hypothetical protein
MSEQVQIQTPDKAERPRYETPRIQAMSEKDILNTFQITQSMGSWWAVPTC